MRIGVMLRALDEKGGVGVYAENITRELLAHDAVNEYVLYYRSGVHVGRFGASRRLRERVLQGGHKAIWDQFRIPMACRRDGVDVIFHPKFTVPLFTRLPTAMVLHGAGWFIPEVRRFWGRFDLAYLDRVMPLYCRRASAILSVSKVTTDDFVERFKIPRTKIHTVYFAQARVFSRVTDPEKLADVRQRYHLPERFILTLSKYPGGDRKNIDGILRAFSLMSGRTDAGLVVAGAGCEAYGRKYAYLLNGSSSRVCFPGYVAQEDLPAVYSMAELFLYPSHMEAFPIPLTEAMACGTPIVTSDAYGMRELAGDAALLVDAGDPTSIADAALRVVEQEGVRRDLSRRAMERSMLFSWERCAEETLAILAAMASE